MPLTLPTILNPISNFDGCIKNFQVGDCHKTLCLIILRADLYLSQILSSIILLFVSHCGSGYFNLTGLVFTSLGPKFLS